MLSKFKSKQKEDLKIPSHIAIIMDGNGRWAKKRALPRNAGHKAGAKTLIDIAEYANKLGVEHLTVYAFSTENWKRPKEEVDGLMKLFEEYLEKTCKDILEKNIKMGFFGDLTPFSDRIKELIWQISQISDKNTGGSINLCINYGGRQEIVSAVNKALSQGKSSITEEDIQRNLYTASISDPDLVIRPSGEIRISNFLLWQIAYAEFYYTDVLWPDFKAKDLDLAIETYNKRHRRFGGI